MQIFLPNKAECHIDTVHYGYFRVYFPTTGIVNGTADYYFSFNGLCFKDSQKDTPISVGAVYNGYNQCDNNVKVTVGGGNIVNATETNDIF